MMNLIDMNYLGEYISRKTKKETIFKPKQYAIYNEDFDYIRLFGNTLCIKHKNSNERKQYKTLTGVINYLKRFI